MYAGRLEALNEHLAGVIEREKDIDQQALQGDSPLHDAQYEIQRELEDLRNSLKQQLDALTRKRVQLLYEVSTAETDTRDIRKSIEAKRMKLRELQEQNRLCALDGVNLDKDEPEQKHAVELLSDDIESYTHSIQKLKSELNRMTLDKETGMKELEALAKEADAYRTEVDAKIEQIELIREHRFQELQRLAQFVSQKEIEESDEGIRKMFCEQLATVFLIPHRCLIRYRFELKRRTVFKTRSPRL